MKKYFFPLIIIAAAVIAYANSFNCSWHLDDFHAIVDYDFDSVTLWQLILQRKQRALGFITFFYNYKLCGYNNLFCWHLVNLIIHIANSLILYAISLKLFFDDQTHHSHPQKNIFGHFAALTIAVIFAVHPIQTSAVTYIVQRIELLCTFFIFLSFYLFLFLPACKKLITKILLTLGIVILLTLGALTKETIVVAPLIMGAYFIIVKIKDWKKRLSIALLTCAAAMIIVIAAMIMFNALSFSSGIHFSSKPFEVLWKDAAQSPVVYYSTQTRVLTRFLRLCVFPYGQCVEYWVSPSHSFSDWKVILALAVHLTIISAAFFMWKKRPYILFGIFWFYICLMPSSILPNGIFEHRIYTALAGLLIAVFLSIGFELLNQPLRIRKTVAVISMSMTACLIICFIFMSHLRNNVWKTEFTLWREGASLAPNNWRANVNFGYALVNTGKYNEAKFYLEKSFTQKSNVWAVANNLGLLYSYLNDIDGSIKMFEYGLKLKPDNRLLKANLGACYLEKGKIDKGTNLLYSARTLESFLTLGNYFLNVKNFDEAVKCYNRVLKKYPNNVEALAGKQAAVKMLKRTN